MKIINYGMKDLNAIILSFKSLIVSKYLFLGLV